MHVGRANGFLHDSFLHDSFLRRPKKLFLQHFSLGLGFRERALIVIIFHGECNGRFRV